MRGHYTPATFARGWTSILRTKNPFGFPLPVPLRPSLNCLPEPLPSQECKVPRQSYRPLPPPQVTLRLHRCSRLRFSSHPIPKHCLWEHRSLLYRSLLNHAALLPCAELHRHYPPACPFPFPHHSLHRQRQGSAPHINSRLHRQSWSRSLQEQRLPP
jgi:hypothetical protein